MDGTHWTLDWEASVGWACQRISHWDSHDTAFAVQPATGRRALDGWHLLDASDERWMNRRRCFPPIPSLAIFRVVRLGRFRKIVTASFYPGK